MTKFTEEQIEQMKEQIIGKKVINLYYDDIGDYFVMEFEGVESGKTQETCFRFMADLNK
jgi:hypothetical protein